MPARESGTATRADAALEAARRVLRLESQAVAALESRLDAVFRAAVERLAACTGRVLTSGVGKSGLVASRLAATLTSTGTPAVYLHPVDALHGDVGLVSRGDLALLVSKSGETSELEALIPTLKLIGIPILCIVGSERSPLARHSDFTLVAGLPEEGCPFDLVPTSSSAAAQALGDALAMAVLTWKGLRREDFAFFHPGGAIGRRGMLRVREVMRSGDALPVVAEDTPLRDALQVILDKGIGLVLARSADGRLAGILTDGDFKRLLLRDPDLLSRRLSEVMTRSPRTIDVEAFVPEAVRLMEENPGGSITALAVVEPTGAPLGVVHLHDCIRVGMK